MRSFISLVYSTGIWWLLLCKHENRRKWTINNRFSGWSSSPNSAQIIWISISKKWLKLIGSCVCVCVSNQCANELWKHVEIPLEFISIIWYSPAQSYLNEEKYNNRKIPYEDTNMKACIFFFVSNITMSIAFQCEFMLRRFEYVFLPIVWLWVWATNGIFQVRV